MATYGKKASDKVETAMHERIDAENPLFDPIVQQALDRPLLPLERRLADARKTGVSGQLQEQIVAEAGVSEKRVELDDLHGAECLMSK